MTTAVHKEFREPGKAPELRVLASGGKVGTRRWMVYQTGPENLSAALTAPGIPAQGAAWSPAEPTCTVQEVAATLLFGEYPILSGVQRWFEVTASYATPEVTGGFSEIPEDERVPGRAFTRWSFALASRRVLHDVGGLRLPNPDGVDVEDGGIRLEVVAYRTAPPQLSTLLPLYSPVKVNANAITFPAVYGTSQVYSVAAGQAKLLPPTANHIKPGVVEMVYPFDLAQDWLVRDRARNVQTGNLEGPVIASTVYQTVTVNTALLWGP